MFNRCKLETLLNEKGWTKYRLAKESGLAQATVHDILSGKKVNPNANTLAKIADALGVSVNEFFDNEDIPTEEKPFDKINKTLKENKIETIAAHFEGEEFTDEDVEDIENFIKFIISKKKK